MKKTFVLLIALITTATVQAKDGFSSLEEQMTGKEFIAAGLNKLSQGELEALNAWIRQNSLGTLAAPSGTAAAASSIAPEPEDTVADRRGLAEEEGDDDAPIRSRILGNFTGWDGQTVFKLENGMIWVQDDRDKFYIKDLENPVAVIEPGLFDSWHLHVEGYKSKCKVKRIQ